MIHVKLLNAKKNTPKLELLMKILINETPTELRWLMELLTPGEGGIPGPVQVHPLQQVSYRWIFGGNGGKI